MLLQKSFLTRTLSTILFVSFVASVATYSDSYAQKKKPARAAGVKSARGAAVKVSARGTTVRVNGAVKATSSSSSSSSSSAIASDSCRDLYISCMDALIPYTMAKNIFLESDDAIKKMQNSEKTFRCIYNNRVKTLYDLYNYSCYDNPEKEGGCTTADKAGGLSFSISGDDKLEAGEVTINSIAYYKALQDIVKNGRWNKLDLSIFDALGVEKDGLEAGSGKNSSGVVNISVKPAIINATDEFNTATSICLSGIPKTSLTGLTADQVSTINGYIADLKSGECNQYKTELTNFYRSGTEPDGDKKNMCKSGVESCTPIFDKSTFQSASSSCSDYEKTLQAVRVEWKSRAKTLIADNSNTIKHEIQMFNLKEAQADVAVNTEITQMQNQLFDEALSSFKDCMRTACRSGNGGEYSGCVDIRGLVESKLLDAGLRCFTTFKIQVTTVADTLAPNAAAYGKQVEEMLNKLRVDDTVYQDMAINAVKKQISENYENALIQSCAKYSGHYENGVCFWMVVRDSDWAKFEHNERRYWDGNIAAKQASKAGWAIIGGGILAGFGAGLQSAGTEVAKVGAQAMNTGVGMATGAMVAGAGALAAGAGGAMTGAGTAIAAVGASNMLDVKQRNTADANGNYAADNINSTTSDETAQLTEYYAVLPGTMLSCANSGSTLDFSSQDKKEGTGGLFSVYKGSHDERVKKNVKENISESYSILLGGAKVSACETGVIMADGWGEALARAGMEDLFFKVDTEADLKAKDNMSDGGSVPVIRNVNEIKLPKKPGEALEKEFEKFIKKNWKKLFPNAS